MAFQGMIIKLLRKIIINHSTARCGVKSLHSKGIGVKTLPFLQLVIYVLISFMIIFVPCFMMCKVWRWGIWLDIASTSS
jgi:hypothetical protein